MTTVPCDVVQEYEVPPGITALRIEAESSGAGGHSSSAVTLEIGLARPCGCASSACQHKDRPAPRIADQALDHGALDPEALQAIARHWSSR